MNDTFILLGGKNLAQMQIVYTPWPSSKKRGICISRFTGEKPVQPHKHDFIELVFLGEGNCSHTYNGTEVPLVPGDTFIVLPHEEHSYKINSKTVIYNCLFYPEILGGYWKELKEISAIYDFMILEPSNRLKKGKQEILHLAPAEYAHVQRILDYMYQEQEADLQGVELVLKGNLVALLVFLGRIWENQCSKKLEVLEEKHLLLQDTLEYISSHLQEDLSINKLAARAYFSPHHFRKVFKEYTGLTPLEYINRKRIVRAVQLMSHPEMTISQIAEAVGVMDSNYFTRLFRHIMGCTPTDYQKNLSSY
jgi:AraC-like DNA-binding protein